LKNHRVAPELYPKILMQRSPRITLRENPVMFEHCLLEAALQLPFFAIIRWTTERVPDELSCGMGSCVFQMRSLRHSEIALIREKCRTIFRSNVSVADQPFEQIQKSLLWSRGNSSSGLSLKNASYCSKGVQWCHRVKMTFTIDGPTILEI
jgi:hypothetical protein